MNTTVTLQMIQQIADYVKAIDHSITIRFRPSRFHRGMTECKVWLDGVPADYTYGQNGWKHVTIDEQTMESFKLDPEAFLKRVTSTTAQRELVFPNGVAREDMARAVYTVLFEEYCHLAFDEWAEENYLSNPFGLPWPDEIDISSATVEDYC